MFRTLLLAAFVSWSSAVGKPNGNFSRSYGVWVSVDQGKCVYWLTDVGLNATQLTEALSNGYQTKLGIEILTSAETPARCVVEARGAVTKAGFTLMRSRRGTDKDRLHGIP